MTEPTTEVIDMDAPNTAPVTRDLQNELAAVMSAWFDKRREKKAADKIFKTDLDDLEERAEELIGELQAGGTQLVMKFGTIRPVEDTENAEVDEDFEEEAD
jgi:hypothetical protein